MATSAYKEEKEMSDTQRRYGDGELITLLQIMVTDYNKIPTQREILSDNRLPTHHTYNKRFGSISGALKLANMEDIKCSSSLHDVVKGLLNLYPDIEILGEYKPFSAILIDFVVSIKGRKYIIDLIGIEGMDDDGYDRIRNMREMMVDGSTDIEYVQLENLAQVVTWIGK